MIFAEKTKAQYDIYEARYVDLQVQKKKKSMFFVVGLKRSIV